VIAALRTKVNGWNRLGLTIFGRTLVLNSCLIAKATFKAMQVPLRNKDKTRIKKEVNRFFRKGKRNNAVPYAQRVLPKVLGGLGQLDTDTHLEMMQAKWVIRFLAGDAGLWTVY
jgi:hypothetical protein